MPKSEDQRNAIMAAATRVIGTQGVKRAEALIAKEASLIFWLEQ
jgi:DNA-binding transcriptional regulator YbjK